ncbi:hypothetical protein [Aquimarina sp. RZ0]|uniref:hypothetical protein n=1 Tax=Aquimarina sp. RZ0 TaxID=2607730 RepID=UPI0011F37B9B|nr:hypothetical protein [Aquimarina sp. RZ0]KAA1247018.1 hypothetical protein F0000_04860 [Aquimarina sp. RZ0]
MKYIRKIGLFVIIGFLFSCDAEHATEDLKTKSIEEIKNDEITKSDKSFDVYIRLVDERSGVEIPADRLLGYGATNIETGELSFDSGYEIGFFESLPEGTYRFDARDGYFDGASSEIVVINSENETADGWVIVTLKYWSE